MAEPIISKTVVQCQPSQIIGNVHMGEEVIIHPTATICAGSNGSVTIGNGCVIEELCVIEATENSHIIIGEGNMFQVSI